MFCYVVLFFCSQLVRVVITQAPTSRAPPPPSSSSSLEGEQECLAYVPAPRTQQNVHCFFTSMDTRA